MSFNLLYHYMKWLIPRPEDVDLRKIDVVNLSPTRESNTSRKTRELLCSSFTVSFIEDYLLIKKLKNCEACGLSLKKYHPYNLDNEKEQKTGGQSLSQDSSILIVTHKDVASVGPTVLAIPRPSTCLQ